MNETNQFYIGYDSLEEWERQAGLRHPSEKVVYLMPIETITQTLSSGLANHELAVISTQLDDHLAHYIRMIVANLTYMQGEYLGDPKEERRARANLDQVSDFVHAWLFRLGYVVIRGHVAMPKDLRLVDGWADFLSYDQEHQRYFCREQVE